MDYNEELMRYQEDAEDRYNDFDMEYEDEHGFEGNEDAYDDYEDDDGYEAESYDDYRSTSIGKIDPNDRTLTVSIENTTDTDARAIIFGGNQEATQPDGVTVEINESSHKEVREESKSNPFMISGMKYSVSDPLQFDNVLRLIHRTATGSITERVYQPRNATSPQNFTDRLIDDDNFELSVTGRDSLQLEINANSTAVFTFTVKARANMGNILKGSNVAELSSTPRITGLPQIDLLRRKRSRPFGVKRKRAAPRSRKQARSRQSYLKAKGRARR